MKILSWKKGKNCVKDVPSLHGFPFDSLILVWLVSIFSNEKDVTNVNDTYDNNIFFITTKYCILTQ